MLSKLIRAQNIAPLLLGGLLANYWDRTWEMQFIPNEKEIPAQTPETLADELIMAACPWLCSRRGYIRSLFEKALADDRRDPRDDSDDPFGASSRVDDVWHYLINVSSVDAPWIGTKSLRIIQREIRSVEAEREGELAWVWWVHTARYGRKWFSKGGRAESRAAARRQLQAAIAEVKCADRKFNSCSWAVQPIDNLIDKPIGK